MAALEARIAELERSNADLERFAVVAAHDLQAPLRLMTGLVELLRRRHAGSPDQQAGELFERTAATAQRMQRLTEDLLLHARVSADPTEGSQSVDTSEVVDEVLQTLDPLIAEAAGPRSRSTTCRASPATAACSSSSFRTS